MAATLDLRPERPETQPRLLRRTVGDGALHAAAGRAEVDLPPDVVLAGYRPFGRSPQRAAQPLFARSLLLEAGGVRTALVLVELMTLPPSLVEAIRERAAAEGAACTLVVATHTHSGPGGYDPAFLPQLALGRYDPAVERSILEAVSTSLAAARAGLTPASVAVGEGEARGLARNRDHKGAPVDDRLTTVALERHDGTRLATLARMSAHPTLNPRSVGPAGDWPGFAMERLEAPGGVAFLLPGAVGDARPIASGKGATRAQRYGEAVAQAVQATELAQEPDPIALGCAEVRVELPPANLSGMVPQGLGTLVSNVAAGAAPDTADAIAFRLGDLALIGVPGEPLAADAPTIEAAAEQAGLQGRVVGLAQGYASYLVGPAEMEKRTASARNAWFGEALTPRLVEAARAATRALFSSAEQVARE